MNIKAAPYPTQGNELSSRRTRLASDVRKEQILDAALSEFSAVGFEGATMDRIAVRVGLTKAGIYAHFKSKDDLLERLLVSNLFNHSQYPHWQWLSGATLEETVDRFLENVYRLIKEPRVQSTFRLLLTESGRAPERIHRMSNEIFGPHALQRQSELSECVANGLVADNAISRKFSIASAPAVQAMLCYWLVGGHAADVEVAEIRLAHREMLLKLLRKEGDQ